jgi:ethanolamine phosphate transferase 2 subunit G
MFAIDLQSNLILNYSLIRSGSAVPFTAHARSPTVTLPRIKAIMTGSVPSFSDIILNIAESDSESTLIHQDSLLAQFKTNLKGELIMYGDDTWLRLFPGMFSRADGTTSFFVSVSFTWFQWIFVYNGRAKSYRWQDFVEVDNNVTRHIADELQNDDWAVMTLHYLGLDHIGHKSGPKRCELDINTQLTSVNPS